MSHFLSFFAIVVHQESQLVSKQSKTRTRNFFCQLFFQLKMLSVTLAEILMKRANAKIKLCMKSSIIRHKKNKTKTRKIQLIIRIAL